MDVVPEVEGSEESEGQRGQPAPSATSVEMPTSRKFIYFIVPDLRRHLFSLQIRPSPSSRWICSGRPKPNKTSTPTERSYKQVSDDPNELSLKIHYQFRLSEQNIGTVISELEQIYRQNTRYGLPSCIWFAILPDHRQTSLPVLHP